MKQLGLHELRKEFLDFFARKNHFVADSFSLIPKDDKSLLLIGAGMAPLKKFFTGELIPPSSRMATCQKCIRTGDIDNVGKTDRHATFFEMLGNFSFGNYFKEEAIEWAWEFLTEVLELDKKNIWVSVYFEDDEAFKIWNEKIGVVKEKIVRLGKEDNFWELEIGPSGPCSEIYFDRGEDYGCGSKDCKPGCDCDRFIEVWNLVFTQFDKDEKGNYNPLPNPNIDTGMGLERLSCVIENTTTIFDIKAIKEIIMEIEKVSGLKYGVDPKIDVSIRVITDHIRAMTFMVSDGILPSNEGRGYVLRRIIRRAARHGKLLGVKQNFLGEVAKTVINSWSIQYPEIRNNEEYILKIINAEESKFQETINQGMVILENYVDESLKADNKILSGAKAFKLYDTYGFPLDLTKEILEEKGMMVDEESFANEMEEQRNRARIARNELDSGWVSGGEQGVMYEGKDSKFLGYTLEGLASRVSGIYINGDSVDSANVGDKCNVILDETPFYAESGGQIGDTGIIKGTDFILEVEDTKKTKDNLIIHISKVIEGSVKIGDEVSATIDIIRRNKIRKNHSATHLLHKALKIVLGEHVNQAGSIVTDSRLRFDFSHYQAVSSEEIKKVERIVNEKIMEAIPVKTIETSLKIANEMGAVGLFEDKYSEEVRVLKMNDFSMELCGGTHVSNTVEIGMFKIVYETAIASGVRRIEAITGIDVYDYLRKIEDEFDEVGSIIKSTKNDVVDKVKILSENAKELQKEIDVLNSKMAKTAALDLLDQIAEVDGIKFISAKVDNIEASVLREMGDNIKEKIGSGVIVLASVHDGKIPLVAFATADVVKRGIHAGNIIKQVSAITGGKGGGRPDMAQAGGKDIDKIDEALNAVKAILQEQIK